MFIFCAIQRNLNRQCWMIGPSLKGVPFVERSHPVAVDFGLLSERKTSLQNTVEMAMQSGLSARQQDQATCEVAVYL
ncbi:hypothetical protein D3C72_2188950 [compost metagenome]